MENKNAYLGDGLYASFEADMVILKTERENGINWVALEPDVLKNFFEFIGKSYNVKIAITPIELLEDQ